MSWVCALSLAGLLLPAGMGQSPGRDEQALGVGGSTGPGPEGAADTGTSGGGLDLKHLPDGVVGLLAARPAALLEGPESAAILRIMRQIGSRMAQVKLPLEKVGQVTWVLRGEAGRPADSRKTDRTIVCQMIEPYDFDHLIQSEMSDLVLKQMYGRTCYAPEKDGGPFVLILDDRTLVVAERQETLEEILYRDSEKLPMFPEAQAWKPFQGDHIVAALNGASFSAFSSWPGLPMLAEVPLSPFAAVWREGPALLGVHLGEKTRLHALTLTDAGEGTARAGRQEHLQVLQAALACSKVLRQQVRGLEESKQGVYSRLLDDYARLLSTASVEQRDIGIHVETFADAGAVRRFVGALAGGVPETP